MADAATGIRKQVSPVFRRVRLFFAWGMVALSALGMGCTFAGDGFWFLEIASYCVPVYLFLGIAGAFLLLCLRHKWGVVAGVACGSMGVALLAPLYAASPCRAPAGTAPNLRIVQANVFEHRGDTGALLALIRDTRPDLVALQEADAEWERRLRPLEAMYPRKSFLPRFVPGGFDLGQYWRIDSDAPQPLAARGIPGVLTTLHLNGRTVLFLHIHPSAPFLPERARHHREQMLALMEFVKQCPMPLMVTGDFNSAPWSPLCRAFQRETGLVSVRQGWGVLGTWPSFFGPLRTGIDQMFVSPGIQVVHCRVGDGIGSDHRPLITELFVPSAKNGHHRLLPRRKGRSPLTPIGQGVTPHGAEIMSQEVQECPTHGPRDCRFRMRVFGVLGILAGMGLLGLGVIAMLAMLPGLSSAMPPGSPAMPSFPMLFGVMAAIMGVVTMIACSLVQLGYLIYVRRFFVAKELAPPEEAH